MRGNSCRCFMTKYFSMNPSNVLILEVLSICMISTQAFKFIKAVETRTDISNSNYDNTSGNDISLVPQRPLFPVNRNKQLSFNPSNYKCNQKHSSVCQNKTIMYREKVLSEFKTSMLTEKDKSNFYNVEYEHIEGVIKYNPSCMILDAKVRYLTNSDTPFDTSEIGCLFPKRELFGKKFLSTSKSCVIVSSAGSLHNSGLGKFIDLHDVVMRFNHAPTAGYEADVGTKTTIRVVNSQVVSKPEFNFHSSPIFENISIAAWDPGKYNATLSDWCIHANNRWHWFTWLEISPNPPSSGFIGLALLLPYCSYIDIAEYIPSTRLNGRCHYYDQEINLGCTFGAWHPLAAEKLATYDMNEASDFSVFQDGIIRIRQPKLNKCR